MKTSYYTHSKARLKVFGSQQPGPIHWVFVPGGPGLGSESLHELLEILNVPGTYWCFDFPDDGSNSAIDNDRHFSNWQASLIEAVESLELCVLVTHSSGGMFALATPEIEKHIIGLVLMDSAPNASWQKNFQSYIALHPLPEVEIWQKEYHQHPTPENLRALTLASAPYFTLDPDKMIPILQGLPFNPRSHRWAENHFDESYEGKWVPQTIPTLIFAGDQDPITPLSLFIDAPDFDRKNILICDIENASHFPWIENPETVQRVFSEYYHRLVGGSV